MILCDIGNTTFRFYDTKKQKYKKCFLDQKLPQYLKAKKVYFISVNEKGTKTLKNHCKQIVDVGSFLQFDTQYQGMGLDRQIACSLYSDAIIVDCGSAVTVDIMKNGKHLGGFILPGLYKLKSIYGKISKKLSIEFNQDVGLNVLPQNTQDAVSFAILQSIVLPIKTQMKQYKELDCIVTGGDGKFLSSLLPKSIYKKELLFEAMKEIIDAHNCITKG